MRIFVDGVTGGCKSQVLISQSFSDEQAEQEFELQYPQFLSALRNALGEDFYGFFVDATEALSAIESMKIAQSLNNPKCLSPTEQAQLDQLLDRAFQALRSLEASPTVGGELKVSDARSLALQAKDYAEQAFWLLHKRLKPDYKPELVLTEPLVTSGPGLTEVYESQAFAFERQRSLKPRLEGP